MRSLELFESFRTSEKLFQAFLQWFSVAALFYACMPFFHVLPMLALDQGFHWNGSGNPRFDRAMLDQWVCGAIIVCAYLRKAKDARSRRNLTAFGPPTVPRE